MWLLFTFRLEITLKFIWDLEIQFSIQLRCLDTMGSLFSSEFWLKQTLRFKYLRFNSDKYVIDDKQTAFLISIINIGKTVKVGNLSTFSKILLSTLNNQNQRVSWFFKIVNVSTQWGYFFRSDWKYSVRD